MNKRIVLILMIHIAVVLWIANGWQKELLNERGYIPRRLRRKKLFE